MYSNTRYSFNSGYDTLHWSTQKHAPQKKHTLSLTHSLIAVMAVLLAPRLAELDYRVKRVCTLIGLVVYVSSLPQWNAATSSIQYSSGSIWFKWPFNSCSGSSGSVSSSLGAGSVSKKANLTSIAPSKVGGCFPFISRTARAASSARSNLYDNTQQAT